MRIIASFDAAPHAALRAGRLALAEPALPGRIVSGYADDLIIWLEPRLLTKRVGDPHRHEHTERTGREVLKLQPLIDRFPVRGLPHVSAVQHVQQDHGSGVA